MRLKNVIAYILLFTCFFVVRSAKAQKTLVDIEAAKKWTSVTDPGISKNGMYAFFTIKNEPVGQHTLVVKSIEGNWKKEYLGGTEASFSSDSRYFFFTLPETGLVMLKTGQQEFEPLSKEILYRYNFFDSPAGELLVFREKTGKKLLVRNLKTGLVKSFPNVESYKFNNMGDQVALVTNLRDERFALKLVRLSDGRENLIWNGKMPSNVIFDSKDEQLAFITNQSIGYYKTGMLAASVLAGPGSAGIGKGMAVFASDVNFCFSKDNSSIFFDLQRVYPKANIAAVKLDVWHYSDPSIQSLQLKNANATELYLSKIHIGSKKIDRLYLDNEMQGGNSLLRFQSIDTLLLVRHDHRGRRDDYWNKDYWPDIYLVFTKTGKRKLLLKNVNTIESYLHISPGGKFVFWYDQDKKNFFSYEISTGKTRDITAGIKTDFSTHRIQAANSGDPYSQCNGISGWLAKDKAILINDRFDVWQVDPLGIKEPLNVTKYEGAKNKTIFRLALADPYQAHLNVKEILFRTFNTINKNSGYSLLDLRQKPILTRLFEGPYSFQSAAVHYTISVGQVLIKAGEKNGWLVKREDAKHNPNYFFSKNLTTFYPISDICPEKKYNWLSAELHVVPIPGGDTTQGVLYKPEDFDPTKKYPVIIHYYNNFGDLLNNYFDPTNMKGTINIPHFVSNGYLVFTPTIAFKNGRVGESALRTVESSAKYLSALPFVLKNKIGLNGHSFGGYETNYIVTHSKLFAAALTGAGVSNLISMFGSINLSVNSRGQSNQASVENGQMYMGVPYWEDLQKYIDDSPIFSARNVTTPMLLYHNIDDGAVPFNEGVQFFTALRRMGKKVWLLQYDKENHANSYKPNQYDVETRIMQFFDHYLKDKPAPKWMTRGIPAKMKGIDDGLALDDEIKTPGEELDVKTN